MVAESTSVNVIKHVSHLSWGADRKMLRLLYTTLVQSKLDYGASKSNVLKRLEPIHRGLPVVSSSKFMHGNGNATAGFFPWHANTQALLQNSEPAKLPYPPCSDRPTGRPNSKNGAHQRTMHKIPNTNAQGTNVVPEIPSWTYPPIRNCPFLETKKQGLLDEEMRAIFLAHLERHPTVHIYTDGSKSTEGVGFEAVFPNTTSGGRLPGEASIVTAELYAINGAAHEILKGTTDGNRFTIFSD